MKTIKLTQGKVALIDECDYARAAKFKWYAHKGRRTYYAVRSAPLIKGKRMHLRLHRFILGVPKYLQVDHINGDGLDCRRANMRLATNAQNCRNRRLQSNNTSGYKGVYWNINSKKWHAKIKFNGKIINLGLYHDPEEAARSYDSAAIKYFRDFAYPNFGSSRS